METKKPLLSYVVKTQYITNNVGLKTLYQKVFTDVNIIEARKKAFEYYNAAIQVLEGEDEITKDSHNGRIIYKNSENYDQGIAIYLRINEDVNKFGIADKADTTYMIAGYFTLSIRDRNRLDIAKNTEKKYFKLLKLQFDHDPKITIVTKGKRLEHLAEIKNLRNQPSSTIDFIDYHNQQESVEHLLESACAFLNTDGGKIIFGQNQNMEFKNCPHHIDDNVLIIEKLVMSTFKKENQNFIFTKRNLLGCQFLEIAIKKSETDCFYNGHFYYRNLMGNVLDMDKNCL